MIKITVYVNILGDQYDCSNDLCVLVLCFVFGRMTQVDVLLVLFSTLLIEIIQGPHVTDSSIIFHSIRVKLLVGMDHGGPSMRCSLAAGLEMGLIISVCHLFTRAQSYGYFYQHRYKYRKRNCGFGFVSRKN